MPSERQAVLVQRSIPMTLEFSNLTYTVRNQPNSLQLVKRNQKFDGEATTTIRESVDRKPILDGLSGEFRPGELSVIMGQSGAGKTTLMNVLAGFKTGSNVQGNITVNGAPRDLPSFRQSAVYVMQNIALLEQLTVAEAMGFAASLKLPSATSAADKTIIIFDILETLRLSSCRSTKACHLSGGERKRLSIALELINNPPIMFLDEPTSGLDSVSSYNCVSLLKTLAKGGRTIICTMHQPSARIFELFDALYLLENGNCLYRGPVQSFVPLVGSIGLKCPLDHNPADFAIDLASGYYGLEWVHKISKATVALNPESHGSRRPGGDSGLADSKWSAQENELSSVAVRSSQGNRRRHRTSKFWNEFMTLLHRSFICVSRDTMLIHIRFTMTVFFGLVIAATFHNVGQEAFSMHNNATNLMFGILFLACSSIMTTVLTFPLEVEVIAREHMNCWYSLKPYYLARTMADLPYQLFFPFLYLCMSYSMTAQPPELFRFSIVLLTGTLVSLVAQSVGLLVGAVCSIQSAAFIGPVTLMPLILMSGFFVSLPSVPIYLRWISWVSYPRYAFQSTLTAVYGYDRPPLPCSVVFCPFKNPRTFLKEFDCLDVSVVGQSAVLVLMVLVSRLLAYWALRYKIKSARMT